MSTTAKMKTMPWKRIVGFSLVLLIPYLILGAFSYPSADDYTYAIPVLEKGFWQAQLDWYQQWSGRFVSTAILSVSPVVFKSYGGYKIIGITTFTILGFAVYYFLASLLKGLFEKRSLQAFFVLFFAIYLSEIPSVSEAFYWFAGVVNYTYAFIVFLFGLGFYLNCRKVSLASGLSSLDLANKSILLSGALSAVSLLLAGFNETLVVIWMFLIFLMEVTLIKRFKKFDAALLLPFAVALMSFCLVFKAPGNAVRAAQFQGNHDILFTVFRPLGLFVEIFFRYLKFPFLIFLLIVIPDVEKYRGQIPESIYGKKSRWLSFFFFLNLVFLFLAPAHWAIGGAPPRRAMNILCFIYMSFTFLMYCQWIWSKNGSVLAQYQRLPRWFGTTLQGWLFVFVLLAFSNHGVAWADLLFRARDYAAQQQERINILEKADVNTDLVFAPLRERPESLFFSDLEKDPTDWINTSVATFFKVKSVRTETKE